MSVNSNAETEVAVKPSLQKSIVLERQRAKSLWIIIHRWIGIIAGLPIAIIGLTGSLILLAPFFLTLQHGDLIAPSEVAISTQSQPATWISNVRAANTNKLKIIGVIAPHSSPLASRAAQIIGHTNEGVNGAYHRVFSVNPGTGKLNGYYDYEDSYAFIPAFVHTSLLIPVIGIDLVGAIGVVLLLSSITGLYLWWPKPKSWKAALRFNVNAIGLARWFSLHNFIGIYCAIAIFILSGTGIWMLKPEWVEPAIKTVTPLREAPPAKLIARKGSCAIPTTIETALDLALSYSSANKLTYLLVPGENSEFFEIRVGNAKNWNVRDGDTTIYVDPNCPRITGAINGSKLSVGETARNAMGPLHSGLMFGTIGQIFVFLAGLALPVLYISGLILWWRRRKQRRAS